MCIAIMILLRKLLSLQILFFVLTESVTGNESSGKLAATEAHIEVLA
jgi:hypothetical protein